MCTAQYVSPCPSATPLCGANVHPVSAQSYPSTPPCVMSTSAKECAAAEGGQFLRWLMGLRGGVDGKRLVAQLDGWQIWQP